MQPRDRPDATRPMCAWAYVRKALCPELAGRRCRPEALLPPEPRRPIFCVAGMSATSWPRRSKRHHALQSPETERGGVARGVVAAWGPNDVRRLRGNGSGRRPAAREASARAKRRHVARLRRGFRHLRQLAAGARRPPRPERLACAWPDKCSRARPTPHLSTIPCADTPSLCACGPEPSSLKKEHAHKCGLVGHGERARPVIARLASDKECEILPITLPHAQYGRLAGEFGKVCASTNG